MSEPTTASVLTAGAGGGGAAGAVRDRALEWRPLLEGAAAERARALVGEIAGAVVPLMLERPDVSLAGGAAGGALLLAGLERAGCREPGLPASRELLAHAVASVRREPLPPSLWNGLGGVLFALSQAAGRQPDAGVVGRLVEWVRGGAGGEYDLIGGVVGAGVVGLELRDGKQRRAVLDAVVERLEATAERHGDGLAWATPPARPFRRGGGYNMGVAHGVPGVVGLLAGVLATPDPPPATRELLDGAARWVLAQRLPEESESAFPYTVGGEDPVRPARLAWCYGDLGIALVLLRAARALGDPELERSARAVADVAAARPLDAAGVEDAGVCHGAAGNGHLFARIAQVTGQEAHRAAAVRWLQRALELRDPELPVAGFPAMFPDPFPDGPLAPLPEPGVLTGAAGVGLVLLAATGPEDPSWDRALLAS